MSSAVLVTLSVDRDPRGAKLWLNATRQALGLSSTGHSAAARQPRTGRPRRASRRRCLFRPPPVRSDPAAEQAKPAEDAAGDVEGAVASWADGLEQPAPAGLPYPRLQLQPLQLRGLTGQKVLIRGLRVLPRIRCSDAVAGVRLSALPTSDQGRVTGESGLPRSNPGPEGVGSHRAAECPPDRQERQAAGRSIHSAGRTETRNDRCGPGLYPNCQTGSMFVCENLPKRLDERSAVQRRNPLCLAAPFHESGEVLPGFNRQPPVLDHASR